MKSKNLNEDFLLKIKDFIRSRFPAVYYWLVCLISPVLFSGIPREFLRRIDWQNDKVVDLGSGAMRRHKKIINIDLSPYSDVDLVSDLHKIPFLDDSIDFVISIAALEHVRSAQNVVDEIYRIMKPGGEVCCYIPFMQGIHAAPYDYVRYTPSGLTELFSRFSSCRVEIGAGPTSSLLWVLQEWIAMFLSLGSTRLYKVFYFILFILCPLKIIDIFLMKHPMASRISSGFTIMATKPRLST